jgi:MFS family permease
VVSVSIALGQLSDRWGRRPLIVAGFVLYTLLLINIATGIPGYPLMFGAFTLGGLGNALFYPPLTATYLDTTAE